jgi:hypothetical protein
MLAHAFAPHDEVRANGASVGASAARMSRIPWSSSSGSDFAGDSAFSPKASSGRPKLGPLLGANRHLTMRSPLGPLAKHQWQHDVYDAAESGADSCACSCVMRYDAMPRSDCSSTMLRARQSPY